MTASTPDDQTLWAPPDGFSVATARAGGLLSPLRHGYSTPTRGIRVRRGAELSLEVWLALLLEVLPPGVACSHTTAAALWELPLPDHVDPRWPVHVMRPTHCPPIRRTGVASHRGIGTRDLTERSGIPVTTLADTWCDLAGTWSRQDLLAAGDVILRRYPDEVATLHQLVGTLRGCRGVRTMRELLPLLRERSASPKESHARLLFHDEGLPEPELNIDVYDDWGTWLATPDFTWRRNGKKVVGEYDGDQHRTDRSAWQYERQRRARLEDADWTYVEMTQQSLTHERPRAELIARLRRELM